MKKLMIICMGVFLVMWSLSADVMASGKNHGKKVKIGDILRANVKAQDDQDSEDGIEIGMQVNKIESSSDEFHDIEFYLEGNALKDAKKVQIKMPTGKQIELKNTVGLNSLDFEAVDLDIEELEERFPEGGYNITLVPKKFGSAAFDMTYDFPPTPVVTNPEADATSVPLALTVEWESLADKDIDGLLLVLDTNDNSADGVELVKLLSTDATSFSIPEGLLPSDTEYELEVVAYKAFDENAYITGIRYINFKTETLLQDAI
ncbi:MAG: hypothetical protein Q6358_07250 [Candidatus Brocadiales bacterium]|nr:hypothetical protein [Candidatus Brocadiales bacterium]